MPAGASTAAAAEELLPMTSAAVELSTLEVDTECQSGESSPKSIYTLSFENLSVFVPGKKSKCYCNRLVQPCKYVAQEYFGMSVQDREPLHALNNITGLLASGELCLILGSNDESKSTLLRALSGRLSKQDKQSGIMALNGRPMMKSYQGWRRICPYVGPSDQDHSPVLTVRETLEFARRCTAATTTTAEEGNNTSSSAQNEAIDRDVHNLMVRLGLDHVADTVIGDENLRGISGGQKRRVTVGEMVLDKNCKYICMENITDGLSSHDSVKLIRDVANTCHKGGYSAFISLLQPSDEIVNMFDKLLVLTGDGAMSYFGPVDRSLLREIFHGTNSSSDDDMGSIADLVLEASLDKTGEAEDVIKRRYDASETSQSYKSTIEQLRSTVPKGTDVLDLFPDDDYPISFVRRFNLISSRRIKLIQRNAVTWMRVFIAILFAIVIGSLFANSPNDLAGSLAKNGYIFLHCFIVLMLSAAVTLPSCFRERSTLFKHRSAEFYDSKSSYIALLITDAPLSVLEACILAFISYFWVGMRSGSGDFFYFLGMLIALEFTGQALGRLLCALCRKQVTANSMSSVIILVFGTVGGFMPSYMAIPPILRWLSWITPCSFAFEGLMLNEFVDLDLDFNVMGTSGNEVTPLDIGGNAWLNVYSLPRSSFSDATNIKLFDIMMVFAFALVYDTLGFYYIEKTRAWYHNQIRRPQATVKFSFDIGIATSSEGHGQHSNIETPWPSSLIGKNICYEVPLASKTSGINLRELIRKITVKLAGKKVIDTEGEEEATENNVMRLLDRVDVHFCRGHMACLMGTSGAGKTTLLDVIAGYKTGGSITGDILIDGKRKDPSSWKKLCGYAEQQDILNPYLTVLETLRFTANCRLPKGHDRAEVVQRVLKLMDIEEWRDHIIGRELDGEGLPKHVRKRVTIANELVSLPRILLLDEPTSGLGTNAAALVMNAVRQATDHMGLITVATIHQPSNRIFDAFDDVVLLTKGGKMTYMGESKSLLGHFSGLTKNTASKHCNPSDFCLSVLDESTPDDAKAAFDRSAVRLALDQSIENEVEKGKTSAPPKIGMDRPNNCFSEVWLLTKRHTIVQWRNPCYCLMRMILSSILSFFLGILFFGDKTQLTGAISSIGAIFFLVFVLVLPMQAAVVPLVEDRAVLYRETVSGCYSRISYGIGQLIADQPFHVINTVLMYVCFYFLVGFELQRDEVYYFLLLLYFSNWVIQSMGQLYALATPNEESASGLGGLSVMLSVILMGFLISYQSMPVGWQWAYWANLFRYILQGLVTNELASNDYHLDVGAILDGANVDQLIAFDGANDTQSQQLSSILGLVSKIPAGTNPSSQYLRQFIECTIANACFADKKEALSSMFISCYLFSGILSRPPCNNELNAVMETVNITTVASCFVGDDDVISSLEDHNIFLGQTPDNALPDRTDNDNSLAFVLCLAGALLPDDAERKILDIIYELMRIAGVVIKVVNNGILIPGELILFFFGWANYDAGVGFASPYKWYYCMFAVGVFLIAIEVFKLVALRFIVWTKR